MDCIQQLHGSSPPRPCQGQDSERTTCGGVLGCLPRNKKRNEGSLSLPLTRNFLQVPFSSKGLRRFPKGERKALWSPPQRRTPAKRRKARKLPSPPSTRNQLTCGTPHSLQKECPEGFQRASGKPFGRLRRGETLRNRGKQGSLLPCHPQEIYFLWEVSSACGRTRYFPRAGKYPKGAGGVQRVHAAWPPPVPPLLSNSAPLASQGRAQLGSRPSLGGPLSPSRLAFTL